MAKGKPWTNEQEKKLRELVEAKMSAQMIAAQMGLTENSVRKKCERLGLEEEDAKGLGLLLPSDCQRTCRVLKQL